jgi:ferredoxin-type protein NapH
MINKRRYQSLLFFLVLIIISITLNYYNHQKIMFGGYQIIEKSIYLQFIDFFMDKVPFRREVSTFLQGNYWSFQIANLKITDPLAFISASFNQKIWLFPFFMAALLPIIASIYLGKIFCGWVCPMGLLSSLISKLRTYLIKLQIPLPSINISTKTKYIILAAGLIQALLLSSSFLIYIYPPRLISSELSTLIREHALSINSIIILSILTIELLFSPRLWCRTLCPGGALFETLSRFRFLRVVNNTSTCTSCKLCLKTCPYQLNPMNNDTQACDQCGICIDQCPPKSLSFQLKK